MKLFERLRLLEGQYMFIKWIGGNDYAKLVKSGEDYYEFNIIDIETMEYRETVIIQHNMLIEVTFGGPDVQRVLAEVSSQLPSVYWD